MIADALNVLVAVCDSASILGTDPTFSPAGAGGAATPLVVLSRILVVHCRVLVKGRVRFVRFVYIFVQLWISLTLWGGKRCWRDVHVALHAGATTVVITRRRAVETVDSINLHIRGQHEP